MRKRNILKKGPRLPRNYPDVLVQHEIDLDNGNINLAIEYYDSISKNDFQKFYINKLNNLLGKSDVVKYLDDIKYDSISNTKTHLELFNEENFDDENNNDNKDDRRMSTIADLKALDILNDRPKVLSKNISVKQFKPRHTFFEKNQDIYQDEVKKFDNKLDKIENNLKVDMVNQTKNFEDLKKKKLERIISKKIIQKKIINKKELKRDSKIMALEDIHVDNDIYKEEIIRQIEEKNKSLMEKEIEEFLEKKMKEMNHELDEIKKSFSVSIKEAEENNYEPIVEGLKEDLEIELQNLKDNYEENRLFEIEKIRSKYI